MDDDAAGCQGAPPTRIYDVRRQEIWSSRFGGGSAYSNSDGTHVGIEYPIMCRGKVTGERMNELKEIRIGDERLMLHDNLVKSSILPRVSRELARDLTLQGNVVVEGAVFAHNLEIEDGPADLMGATMSRKKSTCAPTRKGYSLSQSRRQFRPRVCLSPTARVWFGADLNAKVVRLRNAFVSASIFGEESSWRTAS